MAVTILCPACGRASEFAAIPLAPCPRCGAELPPALRAEAETALARRRPPKPRLLRFATWYFGFAVSVTGVMLLSLLVPGGTYTISDQPVTREEFLRATLPAMSTAGAVLAVLFWGLWRERPWGRPLILGTAGAVCLASAWLMTRHTDGGTASVVILLYLAFVGTLTWYLYRRPGVVAYYRELRRSSDASITA